MREFRAHLAEIYVTKVENVGVTDGKDVITFERDIRDIDKHARTLLIMCRFDKLTYVGGQWRSRPSLQGEGEMLATSACR